jgi:hypothetical protein
MDQAEILAHQFRVAAYVVTWTLQVGYLLWLFLKWRSQKREAARLLSKPR